jgi:hypothetical protein
MQSTAANTRAPTSPEVAARAREMAAAWAESMRREGQRRSRLSGLTRDKPRRLRDGG